MGKSTKEKIILATLDLATEYGLKSLSMSQIANEVGIKKPSLYNHFDSKEQLIKGVYEYLRDKSKEALVETSYGDNFKNKSACDILYDAVLNYEKMVLSDDMLKFYKVIYAERTTDKDAAKIVVEETGKMIGATKALLEALNKENKLNVADIDIAATSFAMTIHGLIDYELDAKMAGKKYDKDAVKKYIKWFLKLNKEEDEKEKTN